MRRFLAPVLLTLSFSMAEAAEQPASMTKIIVRLSGSHIKPGSPAALPKTIYFADPHFARIEDPPNAKEGVQKLVIIAEPDAYSVNLIDRKGTHATDKGGASDLHLPIILPFDPAHRLRNLDALEFGDELQFFKDSRAAREAGPIINAKPTDVYKLQSDNGSAELVVRAESEKPVRLTWRDGAETHTYEYIVFEDLPFNPALFRRPAGMHWRELPSDDAISMRN